METIKKISDFLDEAKVYYLATADGDKPRVRPYGAHLFFDGKIYVVAYGDTNATKQLAKNPNAEICALHGETLRIKCELLRDDRQELKDALLSQHPEFKTAFGENAERAVIYEVRDATATFFKFLEELDSYSF